MNVLKNILLKHTKAAIIVPVILSLIMGLGIMKITIKDDVVEMLPKDMPSRLALLEFEETFGASEFIGITIGAKEGSVFNKASMAKLVKITEELEAIPFVDRVRSLSNASIMEGSDFGLDVYPVMEGAPETAEEIKAIEDKVFEDNGYVGTFVSESKKYFSIYIFLTIGKHTDSSLLYHTIKDIVDPYRGPEEIHISGVPVIAGIIGKAIRNDLTLLIPLVILVLVFILYIGLRNLQGVFLILTIILLSSLPAIGLMGFFNRPFMVINSAMPVILLALSCAYSIHVIMKFYNALSLGKSKKDTVIHAVDELFMPIAATSLTTVVGFLSLVTSPLPVLFEFGIFVSIGIFWSWVLSITLLPALMIILPVPKKIASSNDAKHTGLFNSISALLAKLTSKFKYPIVTIYVLITVIAVFGITRLRIESSIDRFFGKKSEVRLANSIMGEHFGGAANLSIIIDGNIKDPELLNAMLKLQEYVGGIDGIGSTASIADVVCTLNKSVNDNNPEHSVIPETERGVSQLMLLYSMSGDPDDFAMLVNSDFTLAHLSIRMASMYSKDVRDILEKINTKFPELFPDDVSYSITGSSIFTSELSEMTGISSIKSVVVSLIAVFFIGMFMYRSVAFGLLNIIPLSITMIIIYGFMGFAKIDFSVEIAIICSIIIGVGIDYALHYTAKYCLIGSNLDREETSRKVINEVGPPILSNAVSISLGFLVLMLSMLIPIKTLGLLVSISMMLAAIATLTMLSSILNIIKPKINHRIKVFEEEEE